MNSAAKNRLRIGIIFNFRKGWMGGIIYVINLVNALNFLEDKDQPEIIVFYNKDLENFTKEMQYPFLKLIPWEFTGFYKGYLMTWFTRKNVFADEFITRYHLDGLYPINDRPIASNKRLTGGATIAAWIPDLQHKFYPHFFGRKRTFLREQRIKLLLSNTKDLVVSSHDVEGHFRKFYRIKKDLRIHVLQFVSIIKEFSFGNADELFEKYKLPPVYFMVSNQFTNHKNHLVILKALQLLKSRGSQVHVVFTGKMEFKGNEAYIKRIRTMVAENALENCTSFLGVIPRQDQLCLMKHARAIVQPSLFEGWSTVIEDAISLQVPVIASDLPVNIEHLGDKGTFFKRHSEQELADILAAFPSHNGSNIYEQYEDRINRYGKAFLKIFAPQS